jgi:hypothetical protein
MSLGFTTGPIKKFLFQSTSLFNLPTAGREPKGANRWVVGEDGTGGRDSWLGGAVDTPGLGRALAQSAAAVVAWSGGGGNASSSSSSA